MHTNLWNSLLDLKGSINIFFFCRENYCLLNSLQQKAQILASFLIICPSIQKCNSSTCAACVRPYSINHTGFILQSMSHSEKEITLCFQCGLAFTECFKQKDSTSAITAVTKSSMKPWSGANANRHLAIYTRWKEMESKREQR